MRSRCLFISALSATAMVLSGCGSGDDLPAKSKAEIAGTYKGSYAGGTEIFEVRENGTFTQTFSGGTNAGYTSTGNWTYETNYVIDGEYKTFWTNGVAHEQKISDRKQTNRVSRVVLTPFMAPAGESGVATNTKFPYSNAYWRRDPVRIELGVWPYYAVKIEH